MPNKETVPEQEETKQHASTLHRSTPEQTAAQPSEQPIHVDNTASTSTDFSLRQDDAQRDTPHNTSGDSTSQSDDDSLEVAPEQDARPPTALRQLSLQCGALLLVLLIALPYYGVRGLVLPWPDTALAVGASALVLALLLRQAWWWCLIHALFTPLAWQVTQWNIAPAWFLLAFISLLLVYRGALNGQIPLYLSNQKTVAALMQRVGVGQHFLDLGSGLASTLYPLAKRRPDARFTGVENAPASWLIARLRTLRLANCRCLWGDLWQTNLTQYDLVYAFLSPAPMPALWDKVQAEMRPGSWFISNSFAVPEVHAHWIIEVDDARKTKLYCYQC
ncbi:MAG: class I SAM-dependent methyltransferase [Pseudomonadota bacterium]